MSFFLLLAITLSAFAEVTPSTMFGDGMVLQREMPVPVWGRATAGETVTVSFAGQAKATKADADGKWRVALDPLDASSAGRAMTIAGKNSVTLQDVLVGEVWVCSGQSNMQMGYGGVPELKALYPKAQKLPIRHFAVTTFVAFEPQENVRGKWVTAPASSAVAFAFSYYLQQSLKVPVAVIQTCWGSSSIEGWMPLDMQDKLPHFAATMKGFAKDRLRVQKLLDVAVAHPKGAPRCWAGKDNIFLRTRPNILYNAMLHPVAPYAARGMAWYQGEANGSQPELYAQSLPAWVTRLRQQWGRDDFHFLAVMLPGFGRLFGGKNKDPEFPDNFSWAWFREAQMKVLELPHTGVANTIDLGDASNIHPRDKAPIGQRLALLAARDVNGQAIEALGPRFEAMSGAADTITVTFANSAGLTTKDGGDPTQFWLAGDDRKWQKASATITSQAVQLRAEGLAKPVAVRYAFAGFPQVNLVNGAGLPAYPFRSDDWPR